MLKLNKGSNLVTYVTLYRSYFECFQSKIHSFSKYFKKIIQLHYFHFYFISRLKDSNSLRNIYNKQLNCIISTSSTYLYSIRVLKFINRKLVFDLITSLFIICVFLANLIFIEKLPGKFQIWRIPRLTL